MVWILEMMEGEGLRRGGRRGRKRKAKNGWNNNYLPIKKLLLITSYCYHMSKNPQEFFLI